MSNKSSEQQRQSALFSSQLEWLADNRVREQLRAAQRGIEKEGLRTSRDGVLSQAAHPEALGSALTNSWITTDFSEALLEFITPVHNSVEATLDFLADAHAIAAESLGQELIWAASMPCELPEESRIPLAQYGSSNIATMKTVYRRGLGYRYGRAMQTVAGIHYNFSLPDSYWQLEHEASLKKSASAQGDRASQAAMRHYIDTRYLDLIRNFRRNYWLLIYLFGAAPCVDRSFVNGRDHRLQTLGKNDFYSPDATSLRMGDLGYQSEVQKSLFVCYNELNNYIATLSGAIKTPHAAYEEIGVKVGAEYRQLSSGILQIENEFYSAIRPKRGAQAGEKPLHALRDRGIEYVEVRCMDINPFLPLGIDENTMRFLDAFLLYCLAHPSPLCDEAEFRRIAENQSSVVNFGRDPSLQLQHGDETVSLKQRASELLQGIAAVAELLDGETTERGDCYSGVVAAQQAKVDDAARTPSAQLLDTLRASGSGFKQHMSELSGNYMQAHRNRDVAAAQRTALQDIASASREKQADIERSDELDFDEYLRRYYAN